MSLRGPVNAVAEELNGIFHPGVALEAIEPSKTNPRKHFDENDLKELAQSIREKGVIEPIIVRPYPKSGAKADFEIVAGERRWRASKIAEVPTIPAIERRLDDKAVLEIQVIENLQRADVHPLDEANGYKELIAKHGYSADTIAEHLGKSKEYVYGRLKLSDLMPEIQARFYENEITAGHAILLARLPEASQIEAVKNGLYTKRWDGTKDIKILVSVRELGHFIKERLTLNLKHAPFSPKDPELVKDAGACLNCPKRTGSVPALFADLKDDNICTDRSCYDRKVKAFVAAEVANGAIQLTTDYNYKEPGVRYLYNVTRIDRADEKCASQVRGIIIDGNKSGRIQKVCIDPKCKKHGHRNTAAASSSSSRTKESAAAKEKRLAAEKSREDKMRIERHLRRRIYEEVCEDFGKTRKIWPEHFELIAAVLYDAVTEINVGDDDTPKLEKEFGLPKYSDGVGNLLPKIQKLNQEKIAHLIIRLLMFNELPLESWSFDREPKSKLLLELAEVHKVDVKALETEVKEEIARVAGAVQTSASKSKTAKKKKK